MNSKSVATLMRGKLAVPDYAEAKAAAEAQREAQQQRREAAQQAVQQQQIRREYSSTATANPYANYSTTRDSYPGESAQRYAAQNVNRQSKPTQPIKAQPKVGRNDPCPCGSGKKYKNCHGRNQE